MILEITSSCGQALAERISRPVYDPPDFICTIHYLCDVLDDHSPAFSVVPRTHKQPTLAAAKAA